MALQLGDTAPNFIADTTEGQLDFTIGWAILGEFSFHIRKTLLQFAPLSLAKQLS